MSIPPFIIIAFELTILLGGLATLLAVLVLGRLPQAPAVRHLRSRASRWTASGSRWPAAPDQADTVRSVLSAAGAEEVRR